MKEHVFACDGLSIPSEWLKVPNRHSFGGDNEGEGVTDFRLELPGPVLDNLSPRMGDLVRIAGFCFLADQSASRGGVADVYLKDWRRRMLMAIPVRDPDFWNAEEISLALRETLNFVTEDGWEFHFEKLVEPGTGQMRLIETDAELHGQPGCVLLFSGGADSLCAMLSAHEQNKNPFLVSHRASSAAIGHRRDLLAEVRRRFAHQGFRTADAVVNLKGVDAKENTQRSRSMLYASLGTAVGVALGIEDIRLADNGIVSVNLPFTDQAIGARMSRSTHPKFLLLFRRLAELVAEADVNVWNPLWNKTRPETFDLLRPLAVLDLVSLTHSCAHPRFRARMQPHCGTCSQCVDRRFGTMAAGIEDCDLAEAYEVDIFTQELLEGEPRTMATSYFRHALRMDGLTEDQMFNEYPQLGECLDPASGTVAEDGLELARMHQRHAKGVINVMASQIADYADDLARGRLPATCLVSLCAGAEKESHIDHGRREGLRHGENYESIVFRGKSYALTPAQRPVVQLLNESWERRDPPLGWDAIKDRTGSLSRSMSDLFGKSPLWNTLIIEAGARGVYTLDLP